MSKVNFLSGLSADAENTAGLNVESPQEDINKYDSGMPEEFTLADLSSIITQQEANQNRLEVQARQQAQQQILQRDTQSIRELQRGLVEDQEFASPDAVIGSFRSDVSRSFVAGWGDLVEGTGNSFDLLTALVTAALFLRRYSSDSSESPSLSTSESSSPTGSKPSSIS